MGCTHYINVGNIVKYLGRIKDESVHIGIAPCGSLAFTSQFIEAADMYIGVCHFINHRL